MRLINTIHNRLFVPACLVNSLPKSGTNLLAKVVGLFPGIYSKNIHMGHPENIFSSTNSSQTMIPLGVDWPSMVSSKDVSFTLKKLKKGYFGTAHVPFSDELSELLTELKIKTILILRDPRDVIVSHAKYVASSSGHFLFNYYQSLSEHERIMTSIMGVRNEPNGPMLLNIKERLENVLLWDQQPFNYTTYFERLVGPQGGGLREIQLQELRNICRHLGIWCSDQEVESIANQTFGGTRTFRKGTIGGWKSSFTEEHKQVCKELIGQTLIDLGYEKDMNW